MSKAGKRAPVKGGSFPAFLGDIIWNHAAKTHLEKGSLIPVGGEQVGKFGAIIRLGTFNRAGEGFYKVVHKEGRRTGSVFLKSFLFCCGD